MAKPIKKVLNSIIQCFSFCFVFISVSFFVFVLFVFFFFAFTWFACHETVRLSSDTFSELYCYSPLKSINSKSKSTLVRAVMF